MSAGLYYYITGLTQCYTGLLLPSHGNIMSPIERYFGGEDFKS